MPYTPPSSLTPTQRPRLATAGPSSSSHGRHNSEPVLTTSVRAHQPKTFPSSSYIRRHRRSPTVCTQVSLLNGSGQPKSSRNNSLPLDDARSSDPGLWRTALQNNTLIPAGAVISPPDSKSNSSDEEGGSPNEKQDRMLAELEAAIISIDPQSLQSSVLKQSIGKETSKTGKSSAPLEFSLALATEVHENGQKAPKKTRPKLQHTTSSDNIILAPSSECATHTPEDSDRDDDIEILKKPVMVRKKSGELVRPALRPSHKRPSSVPGTPTFSKAVHFDSHLEHIRHFLQVDKPLAVSAGSSPVEGYEGDTEFPFGLDNASERSSRFEWEARIANFPPDTESRRKSPIRLERIFLSSDNKRLIGVVAVANIAFNKHVVARFTLDYWRTTSEVVAEYNNDVRRKHAQDGYDRFNFSILLADQGNLESKRMFVCVRYNVSGLEFWDNNSSMNYHIDFVKKHKPQPRMGASPGLGARPVAAIPRSKSPNATAPRPRSMPPISGDFFFDTSRKLTDSDDHDVPVSPLRMASSGDDDILSDAPARRSKPAPQAFGNRYDFGASLSAAVQSGSAGQTRRGLPVDATRKPELTGQTTKASSKEDSRPSAGELSGPSPARGSNSSGPSRPADLVSEKPYHQSPVYKELVDKYCFYGSSKPAAQVPSKFPRQQQNMNVFIANNDGAASSTESTTSSEESSPIRETPPRIKPLSLPVSPSASPSYHTGSGSHTPSPVPFAHSYHQPMQNTILPESPTPTVIRG